MRYNDIKLIQKELNYFANDVNNFDPVKITNTISTLTLKTLNKNIDIINNIENTKINLTVAQHAIYQVAIYELLSQQKSAEEYINFSLLYKELVNKGVKINSAFINKICNYYPKSEWLKDRLEFLKNIELVRSEPVQGVVCEFKRLIKNHKLHNNSDFFQEYIFSHVLNNTINFQNSAELENMLTIGEQLIAEYLIACFNNPNVTFDSEVFSAIVVKMMPLLTASKIAHIANSFCKTPNNRTNIAVDDIQKILYIVTYKTILSKSTKRGLLGLEYIVNLFVQDDAAWIQKVSANINSNIDENKLLNLYHSLLMIIELKKEEQFYELNEKVIIDGLKYGKKFWSKIEINSPSYGALSIPEVVIAKAYTLQNKKLLLEACKALFKENLIIDSQKIQLFYNRRLDIADWINQELTLIDPKHAIYNEFLAENQNQLNIRAALSEIYKQDLSFINLCQLAEYYIFNPYDQIRFNCWLMQKVTDLNFPNVVSATTPIIYDIAICNKNSGAKGFVKYSVNFKKCQDQDFSDLNIIHEETGFSIPLELKKFIDQGDFISARELVYVKDKFDNFENLQIVANSADTIENLFESIKDLMQQANDRHLRELANIQEEFRKNCITRLATNEFYFYTNVPLDKDQFETLQNLIYKHAKNMSSGVHLILSSFAVNFDQNFVMNVTVHITCGSEPEFRLIVKNNTSPIDPIYHVVNTPDSYVYIKTMMDYETYYVNKITSLGSIIINNKEVNFDFNNLVYSQMPGGIDFVTAIDVCYDYSNNVGKHNCINSNLDVNNVKLSHVLVSNTIDYMERKNISVNPLMHIDPVRSQQMLCKKGAYQLKITDNLSTLPFGEEHVRIDVFPSPILSCREIMRSLLFNFLSNYNIDVNCVENFKLYPKNERDFEILKLFINQYKIPALFEDPLTIELHEDFFVFSTGNDLQHIQGHYKIYDFITFIENNISKAYSLYANCLFARPNKTIIEESDVNTFLNF